MTNDCNCNCSYCYVEKNKINYMSQDTCIKAIRFLFRISGADRKEIVFSGGEPTLNWGTLKAAVIYIREKEKSGTLIGFPTNGITLNADILEFCKHNNVSIAVSLDGAGRFNRHRRIQKNKNVFSILKGKLDLMHQYRDIVRIRITVHPGYSNHLYDNFIFFLNKGFKNIDIQPVAGMRWSAPAKVHYTINLRRVLQFIKDKRRENVRIDLKSARDVALGTCFENSRCPKITEELVVDTDGSILPCVAFLSFVDRQKFKIGEISNPFLDADRIKNVLRYRLCSQSVFHNKPLKNKCASCNVSAACRKLCLYINLKTKSFDSSIAKNIWLLSKESETIFKEFKYLWD